MILASLSAILRLSFAMLAALTLNACSSAVTGPGGTITKVKYFHLQPSDLRQAQQRTLSFEREHIFYGALTAQEVNDRFGHYYAFFWKLDDTTGPVTVRFQYRMAKTGLNDFTQEQVVNEIRRSNISRFEVNGPEYRNNGRISMWKVTLLRGKEELVSQQSYLWN
ncbi:MAG: hypothetical protein RIS79_2832 [Verrucomicrobiota bacterium]|jgi:hypothetical protein